MKKKIGIVVCSVFVIAMLSAMFIFIFSDGRGISSQNTFISEGNWRVVANVNNDKVSMVENEFMELNEKNTSNYMVKNVTENIVRLYKDKENYILLVKCFENNEDSMIEQSAVVGKWQVICHAGSTVNDEYFNFDEENLQVYRNGETEAYSSVPYSWIEENRIIVESWSKDMLVYEVSGDTIVFVEIDTGYPWEITKVIGE